MQTYGRMILDGDSSYLEYNKTIYHSTPDSVVLSSVQDGDYHSVEGLIREWEDGREYFRTGNFYYRWSVSLRLPKSSGRVFSSVSARTAISSFSLDESECISVLEDDDYSYLVLGAGDSVPEDNTIVTACLEFEISIGIQTQSDPSNTRSSAPFTFWKNGFVQFKPGAGTRIHFANRDVDTLTLVGLPAGLVTSDDTVVVKYLGTRVFTGQVERIVDSHGRGDQRVQEVLCHGPWGALSRLVFRQTWHPSATVSFASARVVLNQKPDGIQQSMTDTVREILSFAASKCGYSYSSGNVSISDLVLPNDETRDITCADALRRELRFFPRKIVRFDYSKFKPSIIVGDPVSSTDASYVDGIPKTARRYEYSAHPIKGVHVYTGDLTTVVNGTSIEAASQKYPANVSVDDIDVLHCYIPLAPGSSSTSFESLEVTTEEIGVVNGVSNEKEWWRTKHPRLHDVASDALTITEFGYTFPGFQNPKITDCTVGALKKFGLQAEVVRFHCKAKIQTEDDVEEDIYLTMDFTVTNANTRTYTQQTGSSSEASEILPEGLAKAIYEQRCGSLKNETMTVRLGNSLPVIGDSADGLLLQEFDVDCDGLTADLHFGQPEYLSAEDMRSLLNGFRQRGFASNAALRADGEPDEDSAVDVAGIQPVSSTEFCPGKKAKTVIKSTSDGSKKISLDASGSGGGDISLKTSEVRSGETIGVHKLTYTDAEGTVHEYCILSCADIDIKDTKGSGSGTGGSSGDSEEPVEVNVLTGLTYDAGTRQLIPTYKKLTVKSSEDVEETASPIFTAVEHTAGMDG